MDIQDNFYVAKYHPDTAHIIKQALSSFTGLLLITLLTLGTVWFTSITP